MSGYSQTSSVYYSPSVTGTQSGFSSSRVFRQEIARFEVTVSRDGKPPLSLTQVPRVEEGDVLRVKLLEESVGGTKPDQSNFDWTLTVAFINPNRNDGDPRSVTEEIRFREKGWYKEHLFRVPYDSQPIIFLYTKPKYRNKISNLINKNPEDIRKLGEKTIEIAGAYAQIGSFLNELQDVLNWTQFNSSNQNNSYNSGYNSGYNSYNSYNSYGSGTSYNPYGSYNNNYLNRYVPGINNNAYVEQIVERVAKSFNIQLPQCWRPNNNSASTYNSYGSTSSYNSYGTYGGTYGQMPQDLVGRMQCIAQNVRVEDLDISLSKMIQQGGVFVAAQFAQKYPQIAYWINLAAAAMDLIVKITRKAALKIVPTVVSSIDPNLQSNPYQTSYPTTYSSTPTTPNSYTQGYSASSGGSQNAPPMTKISVYAENQPGDDKFVTAYPVIVHKWQPEPDPETLALGTPVLLEPCLHPGQNIIKNTTLAQDWVNDSFSRNFKLTMTSANGFSKEFPLRKNAGLMGWDLNLTREDLAAFPKVGMTIEGEVTGTRGFTELKSPKFPVTIASTAKWEIAPQAQKNFTIGGKRRIALTNALGSCFCLQSVVYKPSFGGQFVFEANGRETGLQFSPDGKEAWFSIDATEFKSGVGTLEVNAYGGEKTILNLKAYPLPPKITEIKISKGDREAVIKGERLEQIQFILINGIRAKITPGNNNDERIAVFEDLYARQTSETVSLALLLDEERQVQYPETFRTAIARPLIASLENKEIEGDYVISGMPNSANSTVANANAPAKIDEPVAQASKPVRSSNSINAVKSDLSLEGLPVIPIYATGVSVHARNALTDYDFKAENIEIDARIEKGEMSLKDLVKTQYEVLDWKNLRINFELSAGIQKMLGGRRLQFRIKDKARGNSDWYTIKQTFVRIPQIASIVCSNNPAENCEIKGEGLDYIAQISADGGQSWFPKDGAGLIAKVAPDGTKTASIPYLANKSLLQIKLKDFPNTSGLIVSSFRYAQNSNKKR